MLLRPLLLVVGLGCRQTGVVEPILPAPDTTAVVDVRALTCPDEESSQDGRFQRVPLELDAPSRRFLWAAGASVGDIDGDGDLDAILLAESGPVLFRWPGLAPEPVADLDLPSGSVLVDVDGDHDLDLYLSRFTRPDALLVNDGTGTFTQSSGLPAVDDRTTVAVSFADVDGDGDLDGFAGSFGDLPADPEVQIRDFPAPPPAHLWINDGTGVFEDRGAGLPDETHRGYTLAGGLHDLDADGATDIYVINDWGGAHGPNAWLRGDGSGGFTHPDPSHGLNLTTTGMGLALGDLNGDGFEDLAVAYWGGIRILDSLAGPDLAWFDQTAVRLPMETPGSRVAWGLEYADIDNDGDLDLYANFAYLEWEDRFANNQNQADRLFLNLPDQAAFADVSDAWGLSDSGTTRGSVLADFDDDGWLDILRASQTGPALLLSRCGAETGTRVALRQEGPNTRAIGARITAHDADGSQLRVVRAGGTGFATSGPPEVHFGTGPHATIELEIRWPDGAVSTHPDVPTQSRVTVTREGG